MGDNHGGGEEAEGKDEREEREEEKPAEERWEKRVEAAAAGLRDRPGLGRPNADAINRIIEQSFSVSARHAWNIDLFGEGGL